VARKNVRELGGVPLIVHTIVHALAARAIERVVVSTDDAEIADISQRRGAEVVWRPAALATDTARTGDAIRHVLGELEGQGYRTEAVVTLQPTSPLRERDLIDRVADAFVASDADTAFTVTPVSPKLGRIEDERFVPLYPPDNPRQALDRLYVENGNVYVTRATVVQAEHTVFGKRLVPVVIDAVQGLDIDTELDLAVAELWLSRFPARFGGVNA
jgi:CMP-N-acetylneuraminic acid synthetase